MTTTVDDEERYISVVPTRVGIGSATEARAVAATVEISCLL
jgi:hypothetical protein